MAGDVSLLNLPIKYCLSSKHQKCLKLTLGLLAVFLRFKLSISKVLLERKNFSFSLVGTKGKALD